MMPKLRFLPSCLNARGVNGLSNTLVQLYVLEDPLLQKWASLERKKEENVWMGGEINVHWWEIDQN
jgi:hypothetical protein